MKISIWILAIIMSSMAENINFSCLKGCVCNHLNITCSGIFSFTAFSFPPQVTKLHIVKSYLGPQMQTSFSSYMDLVELNLSQNRFHVLGANIFKFLRKLEILDLNHNHLVRLDNHIFQHLSSLRTLDLSFNDFFVLPDIPFRYLTSLQIFNISHNKLQNAKLGLRFQVMTNLHLLDMSHNNFTHINSDTFEMTRGWRDQISKHINLSYCGISAIDENTFRYPVNLRHLRLAGNPGLGMDNITAILNSSTLEELKHLDISDMNLLNITGLIDPMRKTSLNELILSKNNLKDIPIGLRDYFRGLRVLDISNNELSMLTKAVTGINNLVHLDASHNKISQVDDSFSQLTNLRRLHLNNNNLSDNKTSVENLASLQLLDLSFNTMTRFDIPNTLTNLQEVSLAGNKISKINSMTGLRSLKKFDISGNRLRQIPGFLLRDSTSILITNFSSNLISEVDHQALRPHSPEIVDLSNNKLKKVWNIGWKTTTSIDLSGNLINDMDDQSLYALYSLHHLDLSSNNMSHLNPVVFIHLNDLKTLQLQNNKLKENKELHDAFQPLEKLISVDLSHNRFTSLLNGTFRKCQSLETIKMNDNLIQTVHASVFSELKSLKEMDLSNSNFYCSCDLISFQNWFLTTHVTIIYQSNDSYQCKSPNQRIGTDVTKFKMKDFECDETLLLIVILASAGGSVMFISVISALVCHYYCRRRKKKLSDCSKYNSVKSKVAMNGSVPMKDRKRHKIPTDILRRAKASDVERLLKAEHRKLKTPKEDRKKKTVLKHENMSSAKYRDMMHRAKYQNAIVNPKHQQMIIMPTRRQAQLSREHQLRQMYMERRNNPYIPDRSRSHVDLRPYVRRSNTSLQSNRVRNPYHSISQVDVIRRPQPRYSRSMPDMLDRVHTLPKPRPPRPPVYISREHQYPQSTIDLHNYRDYRPWIDEGAKSTTDLHRQRNYNPREDEYTYDYEQLNDSRDYRKPAVHSGYYTIGAKMSSHASGNRTQWI